MKFHVGTYGYNGKGNPWKTVVGNYNTSEHDTREQARERQDQDILDLTNAGWVIKRRTQAESCDEGIELERLDDLRIVGIWQE